jgi:hypothetical protein
MPKICNNQLRKKNKIVCKKTKFTSKRITSRNVKKKIVQDTGMYKKKRIKQQKKHQGGKVICTLHLISPMKAVFFLFSFLFPVQRGKKDGLL